MKIFVGTQNRVKILAVSEVISGYPSLGEAEVVGLSVQSGVSDQPCSLEETVLGAKHRAEASYCHGNQVPSLGVGLESGLMLVPTTRDEYMDLCICAIYDGREFHIGMSCGFRLPRPVSHLILEEGLDLNQAMERCGYTDNPTLGSAEGSIGLFTRGRICRKEYCKQSLITALISVEHLAFTSPQCV